MFAGQGSQYYQMGRKLFEHHPVYTKWLRTLDETIRTITGASVIEELYADSRGAAAVFDDIRVTHPAIFMVEYALCKVLTESGITPDYVLGASLGEYTSAAVSGVFEFEVMLGALDKQVEILKASCPNGGMIAIVDDQGLFRETPLLYENSELAARNYPSHFNVSTRTDALKEIENFLKGKEIAHQTLPVPYGFHSSLIDPAASRFMDFIRQEKQNFPQIPLISCAETEMIQSFKSQHWWDVARKPVDFQKTIQKLERKHSAVYVDVGPSGTLANFVKYNLAKDSESEIFHILSPFGNDIKNLEKVIHHLAGKNGRHASPVKERSNLNKGKDNKMLTWVFPGQGSQKKGMGGSLFNDYAELTGKADDILGYSVEELCLEDPQGQLNQTRFTQPALYVVNALSWFQKREETGKKSDFVAGHSLGEYSALLAAGAIDFETGLKLVKKRGELMSQASGGAMAAVLNASEEKIVAMLDQNGLNEIDIANYNTPSQIVISGLAEHIDQAEKMFGDQGVTCIPLPVSGAFHSRYMQAAREEFEIFLKGFQFSELKTPLISNVHARPYPQSDIVVNLADQITHSVKWSESICYLMGQGDMAFEEVGPGRVLTGLIDKIEKEGEPLRILQKAESDGLKTDPTPDPGQGPFKMTPELLGSDTFKKDYGLRYAYVAGAMVRGIASKELVVRLGKAGMMGFLGTGGMNLDQIEKDIRFIQKELKNGRAYGMNLLNDINDPEREEKIVDLYLQSGIRNVEAAAFLQISPALVRYRLKGLDRDAAGSITAKNKVMAKVSRPEVAAVFLNPAPENIVNRLFEDGKISEQEAALAKEVPMADDLCVESDSGGHTDQGVMTVLLPTMIRLRDETAKKNRYRQKVRVGAAGGIGTPEAAASAFLLGADFILTGSINQCTAEAGTSDAAKDILQQINVQDTAYAPAADIFEFGSRVQVVRKSLFFPARANKLYDLYRHFDAWEDIDAKTRSQIEERYFKCRFEDAYAETKHFFSAERAEEIEKAERNPKHKMALVFRWYLGRAMHFALEGSRDQRVDYQIHCGPALGAFNQWVKGTDLEDWRNRHVDQIAEKLMQETSEYLNARFQQLING